MSLRSVQISLSAKWSPLRGSRGWGGTEGEGESRGRTQGSFRTLLAWRLGGIVLLMRKADAKAGKLSELFLGTQVRGLPETGGDEARQITDASCLSHECL